MSKPNVKLRPNQHVQGWTNQIQDIYSKAEQEGLEIFLLPKLIDLTQKALKRDVGQCPHQLIKDSPELEPLIILVHAVIEGQRPDKTIELTDIMQAVIDLYR